MTTRRQRTTQDAQRQRVTQRRRGRKAPAWGYPSRSQAGMTLRAWRAGAAARLDEVKRVAGLHDPRA